jgi:hypothetical protein
MKPVTEKQNKRNTHSLWEEVHNYNPSICGKYFSLWDLHIAKTTGNSKLRVQFPIIVGFDDLLPFQFFTLYPSAVLGDLALVIRVSPDALVWCSVHPAFSLKQEAELNALTEGANVYDLGNDHPVFDYKRVANGISTIDQQFYYDKRFTQLNAPGRAASNVITSPISDSAYLLSVYKGCDLVVRADNITTWEATSTICGFGLKDVYLKYLQRYYSVTPFVAPGEVVRVYNFSTGPSDGGLQCMTTLPMLNVKEVITLFPRYATDLTCFHNPCLTGLQIQMLSRNWPDQPQSTTSPEFFRLQLEAANLDSVLPCTESFENSYTTIPTYNYPIRDRSRGDDTDFAFVLPTERGSANAFFFDGVSSRNETISLKATPLTVDENGQQKFVNTYYVLNRNQEQPQTPTGNGNETYPYKYNTTAPIIALVSDSFFIIQAGKIAIYESGRTWNEIFQEKFPQLYEQLYNQITRKTE